jgi:hypothetical protein
VRQALNKTTFSPGLFGHGVFPPRPTPSSSGEWRT